MRYASFGMPGWHRDYDPCLWKRCATGDQKRVGWEMWVRMEKIIATVSHERQVEEAMDALEEGQEDFYRSHLESVASPPPRALRPAIRP